MVSHDRSNILSIYQSKEIQFFIKNSYSDQFQRMIFFSKLIKIVINFVAFSIS